MPRAGFGKDYYVTLGISREASDEEIRKSYRRLALEWHPDRRPGDPRAADRFKDISEAYAVLINPAKRQEYAFASTPFTKLGSFKWHKPKTSSEMHATWPLGRSRFHYSRITRKIRSAIHKASASRRGGSR